MLEHVRAPRLVATDVDGTLLGADDVPSPRTRAVLARMIDAGVPLVLATGRPPRWVRSVCDAVGVHGLVVAANGAVLYDAAADRVLDAATLDPPDVAAVVDGLHEVVPGCGVAVERVGRHAADTEPTPFVCEAGYRPLWAPVDVEVSHDELVSRPVIKVLARHEDLASDAMAVLALERVGHLVDITYSALGGLIECSVRGVTKAFGLARAAERLDVDAADVLAFGDMPNDLPMLAWAGHGVSVANGHPEVLAAAAEVTTSNLDDGVASVLERWF